MPVSSFYGPLDALFPVFCTRIWIKEFSRFGRFRPFIPHLEDHFWSHTPHAHYFHTAHRHVWRAGWITLGWSLWN
jgi:hypothetical protein